MKTGFPYYNVDTDKYQDRRIKRLRKDCGCDGVAVYDYILCEIYRVRGYFLEWDESSAFDVADYFGLKESTVNHVVDFCCAVGLFDRALLTSEGILSSRSIQQRFTEMCRRAKRNRVEIPENFRLIPEEYDGFPEKAAQPPEVRRKVKYSREKERKIEQSKQVYAPAPAGDARGGEAAGPPHTSAPSPDFLAFQQFILRHAVRVSEMKEPFTEQEFRWMCRDFKPPVIKTVVAEMHNYGDLFKNVNAYITFKKFIKARR